MEVPEEHRFTQVVQVRIKICRRHRQDQIHPDVTQILPKTNSTPSIINNDQHIQVNEF